MIIDLERFIRNRRPYWVELESILDMREKDPVSHKGLEAAERFHYLYERVSADLGELHTFGSERATRAYLESLVARAYGEIHETRSNPCRLRPLHWFFVTFPNTFRRRIREFQLASAIGIAGCIFGVAVILFDPGARDMLMPFENLLQDPSERVAREERITGDMLRGLKAQGAAWYMQHNTRVAILTMALGMTWGIGTAAVLFSTGIMVGAVAADYIASGETVFLVGWLLPHGSVELPAILLAGQAGFVLAGALLGRRSRLALPDRLRNAMNDLVTLILGVAVLLVWAGGVEAFLSQYHEPVIPYALKIAFGCAELVLLCLFLSRSGRRRTS